ncbi:MAG TPA: hypothetical protein VM260_26520, partial [Pirellula sp.]|nr:hypothetical protein [Pirellula sp.]
MIDDSTNQNEAVAPSKEVTVKRNVSIWFFLFSALLASFISGLIVAQIDPLFPMPDEFKTLSGRPTSEYMSRYKIAFNKTYSWNYATDFAILGASIGFATGAFGALTNRIAVLMVASVFGALAGALGGFLLGLASGYCIHENHSETILLLGVVIEPMIQTVALHCFAMILIGIGVCVSWTAMVLGPRSILKGIEGGVAGGLLAGITYSVAAATFFPGSSSFLFVPVPHSEIILWSMLSGLCVALGLI